MVPVNDVTIRASMLVGFRELVRSRALNFEALLDDVGLRVDDIDNSDNLLPFDSVALLMERAAEQSNDPCLGFAFAEAYPKGASGVLGYLVLHARTVREALATIARYGSLVLHPITVELREERDVAALAWRFPVHLTGPRTQFSNFTLAMIVLRLRQIAGGDWFPQLVEMEHREPPCAAMMHRIFGPRVSFNSHQNCVTIDSRTLMRRSDTADPRLYTILEEAGQAKLNELTARTDIVARTARAITETLHTSAPLLDKIAERMRVSPRSLQKRLSQQGTSFERVLSETRRALALRYLRDTDMSLTEIGFLLGFSEQSAFTRATKGWFGKPPRVLRDEARRSVNGR